MNCTVSVADQLKDMPRSKGWLDGEGEPVSTLTIIDARRQIDEQLPAGLIPFLYPTEDGGISVEWDDYGGGQFKVEPIAALMTAADARLALASLREDD